MPKTKTMTRVEKLYHSPRADQLFAEAQSLFPRHGGNQATEATHYIVGKLAPKSLPSKSRDELWNMVYAGLT